MMLRRLLLAFFTLVLLLSPLAHTANAQTETIDASKRAKAEQLFTIMHMDQTYGQLMTQLTSQTDQMIQQLLPQDTMTDEQRVKLADFKMKVNEMVSSMMSWDSLKPDYIKLYADTYSETELDGIIAFYRSPVGEKMLEKTPELLKASSTIAMSHMGLVEPKLHQMMNDFEQQMKEPAGKSQ
jgi:hypothetical protein